jgi:signal transduction histidine kinase
MFQPLEGSFLGQTLQGESKILGNLANDPQVTSPDPLLQEHGVVSGISAAVKGGRSGLLGALGIFTAQHRHFSEDDLHFVEGLANVVGAAMDRQRSEAEIRKHQEQVQHLQRLESIGQLTAGVAHDYNNVLTVIHGHVTLVLGDPHLPAKSATSLKTALEAVERAANLTRQLLAFSRKQSMCSEVIDLNAVIGGVTKMMGRFLGENIRLEFRPGASPATVQADPGMMEQVIMNLSVNARDAMPSGGSLTIATELITVQPDQVESHPGWRAGQFVRIKVTDTGCGMDETTVGRIFEPFFTTKGPGKGTGLGLATVYGIVQQHQGWIDVESRLGKGTSFSMYLPSLAKAVPTRVAAQPELVPRGQQETILLVEDEPALRQLARLLLEDFGYTVVEAGSGAEALLRWGEHKQSIKLLLTDLILPDALTGFDLAEMLRKQCSDLKVVITSGYEAGKIPGKLPGGAGFHFIQKPYRTAVLARTIRESLSGVPQSKVDSVS